MTTVPEQIEAGTPRGITRTLANFVIETENIVPNDIAEPVPDQKNAVADEISYDTRTDLRLTVRSAKAAVTAPPAVAGALLTYGGVNYKVDSVDEAGTYNGLRRWNITGHKYENYPAQPSAQANNGGSNGGGT